jgi:hypothetical protein
MYVYMLLCLSGEFVIYFARIVGLMVAIVAIIFTVMIMMALRALLAICISKWGVFRPAALVFAIIIGAMKLVRISPRSGWAMLTRACS